jgi:hypothetical protein
MWQNPDQYLDFRTQMRKKLQRDGQVKEKILGVFTEVYEQTLKDSRVVLSRPEWKRLFEQLLEDILTELINENKSTNG